VISNSYLYNLEYYKWKVLFEQDSEIYK